MLLRPSGTGGTWCRPRDEAISFRKAERSTSGHLSFTVATPCCTACLLPLLCLWVATAGALWDASHLMLVAGSSLTNQSQGGFESHMRASSSWGDSEDPRSSVTCAGASYEPPQLMSWLAMSSPRPTSLTTGLAVPSAKLRWSSRGSSLLTHAGARYKKPGTRQHYLLSSPPAGDAIWCHHHQAAPSAVKSSGRARAFACKYTHLCRCSAQLLQHPSLIVVTEGHSPPP